MKYIKIIVDLHIWHLKPYHLKERNISDNRITEFGLLCFKLIITWKTSFDK